MVGTEGFASQMAEMQAQKKELPCSEGLSLGAVGAGYNASTGCLVPSAPFGGPADCFEELMGGEPGAFCPYQVRAMESLRAPLGNSLLALQNLAAKLIFNFS